MSDPALGNHAEHILRVNGADIDSVQSAEQQNQKSRGQTSDAAGTESALELRTLLATVERLYRTEAVASRFKLFLIASRQSVEDPRMVVVAGNRSRARVRFVSFPGRVKTKIRKIY